MKEIKYKEYIKVKNCMITLNAECMCKDDNGMWFVSNFYPFLYYYDLKKEEILECIEIPVKSDNRVAKFSSIHAIDNNIYLIPNNEQKIYIYQLITEEIKEIDIENPVLNMFRESYVYDSYIYCIPYRYDKVVKLNIVTNEVHYINLPNDLQNVTDRCLNSICRKGDVIYCAVWKSSKLLVIDLKEDTIKAINLFKDNYNHSIAYICFISNLLYIFDDEIKKIYCIEMATKKIIISKDMKKTDVKIISVGNTLILDDTYIDEWSVMDKNLKVINFYKEKMFFPCEVTPWKWAAYMHMRRILYGVLVFMEN